MKTIKLTQNKYALVDDEDFEYLSQFKWYYHNRNYAARQQWNKNKKVYENILMHRLILRPKKDELIDHMNFNGLDNRKVNLRICTKQNNNSYRTKHTNNKSGYKGVTWHKVAKKWRATITTKEKHMHLGYFIDPIQAALAYNQQAKLEFGEFAFINNVK